MTEVARTYLGNINNNPDLSELVTKETCLQVHLTESDRLKGRIHTQTTSGITIGIIKSRDHLLRAGDVFETQSHKLLLISLQEQEFLVLDFSRLESNILPKNLVCLGHILGNHHYPLAIKDDKIYIKLTTDKSIIEKMIQDLNIPGLQIRYEVKTTEENISFASHSH